VPKHTYVPQFRIIETVEGFSPQMSYLVRGKDRWFSLLRDGHWADPDGWNVDDSDGESVTVFMQTREMADAAIAKARKINAGFDRPSD
jgi:hypothetical protein